MASSATSTARVVVVGLGVAALGIAPWALMATVNARVRPDLPWAATATAAYLALWWLWLDGVGWPRATKARRRFLLRARRPHEGSESPRDRGELVALVLAIAGMYVLWILASAGQPAADLTQYPTTSLRISLLVIGAVVSGVVEEAAFRGYIQRGLEEAMPLSSAIVTTSVVFVLAHVSDGLGTLLLMAPGRFVASVLYGLLAARVGSILPGIALHVGGDALHTIFVLLEGDVARLWVTP